MIPQRIELWTYPYQEYALPIKLRNLKSLYLLLLKRYIAPGFFRNLAKVFVIGSHSVSKKYLAKQNYCKTISHKVKEMVYFIDFKSNQIWTDNVKFEASSFTIKLCSLLSISNSIFYWFIQVSISNFSPSKTLDTSKKKDNNLP